VNISVAEKVTMKLTDSCGRKINYLRLAVTDRCNLRCSYCMPSEGVPQVAHADILSYEELFLVAQTAVSMGIEKIRVTGGEPLVRKGILGFLARLRTLPDLKQLVLTTNGLLLEEMATELRDAGVQSLNVSLDSFRPETFAQITRCGDVRQVLRGIAAAERAGIPVKINMVVMRGVNDDEIIDFAELTLHKSMAVRFIEYMPTIKAPDWQSLVIPGEEILGRLAQRFELKAQARTELSGPAENYRIEGASGTVGVITPLSGHFCSACNRIRLTSVGKVRSCLFSAQEYDLKPLLRAGDGAALKVALRRIVREKPDMHQLNYCTADHQAFAMSSVGG
jgi:cyclic pyranopterin phosphate synthase